MAQPKTAEGRFAVNPDPRCRRLMVRLTESEWHEVCEQAEAGGLSLSEYSRRRMLGRPVRRHTDAVMIRELHRIAGLQKHLCQRTESGQVHADKTAEIVRLIEQAILKIAHS